MSGESIRPDEPLFRAVMESTADGILVVSAEGSVVCANQRFAQLWRIPDELVKRGDDEELLRFVCDQLADSDSFLRKIEQLYRSLETDLDFIRFLDGRIFERYSAPLMRDGECAGRVWSFRDITDKSRVETALRHAQKMQAVGQIAGGIAHDFNNVLTAILGNAELLIDSMDERTLSRERLSTGLEEINKAAQHAATLTRQLLQFARKDVTSPTVINLNETLRESEKMLRQLVTEDIVFEVDYAADLRSIFADPSQIQHAVMNLVINARDAMPEGGRLIVSTSNVDLDDSYVATQAEAQAGPHVVVKVHDTGRGMDPQTRERAFEPFFTTKEPGQGTGLGLATVYGTVKQAGGHIRLETKEGRGTGFYLYLPVAEGGLQAGKAEEREQAPTGDERILLCEDDDRVRKLTFEQLHNAGYTVVAAENGAHGLELAAETPERFDLLITDVIMPDMNGKLLSDRLTDRYPDLKTLFVSGYSADIIANQGALDDGVRLLEKPFNRAGLLQRVRHVLDE